MAAVRHDWSPRVRRSCRHCRGICWGATWDGGAPSASAHLIDEIVEYYEIFSRETQHLVEVPADQMEELTAWLGERVGRAIKVPDLTVAVLRFAGGRMLVVSDRPKRMRPTVVAMYGAIDHALPLIVAFSRRRRDCAWVARPAENHRNRQT